jgi:hypothetical protein
MLFGIEWKAFLQFLYLLQVLKEGTTRENGKKCLWGDLGREFSISPIGPGDRFPSKDFCQLGTFFTSLKLLPSVKERSDASKYNYRFGYFDHYIISGRTWLSLNLIAHIDGTYSNGI